MNETNTVVILATQLFLKNPEVNSAAGHLSVKNTKNVYPTTDTGRVMSNVSLCSLKSAAIKKLQKQTKQKS